MAQQRLCLFVDDDDDDQDFFCDAVKEIDPAMHCFFANDGFRALSKLEDNDNFDPDFIFIDMNMPRMSGIECLSRIRKMDRLADTRILMYSSAINDKMREEVISLGAEELLQKPSTFHELRDLLSGILNR